MRAPDDSASRKSTSSDNHGKISNSNLLESIFDDLDDELEKQYQDEEIEFFHLETQVVAEELVEQSINAALQIIIAENIRQAKEERILAAKSEIVIENLRKPSEIRRSQRAESQRVESQKAESQKAESQKAESQKAESSKLKIVSDKTTDNNQLPSENLSQSEPSQPDASQPDLLETVSRTIKVQATVEIVELKDGDVQKSEVKSLLLENEQKNTVMFADQSQIIQDQHVPMNVQKDPLVTDDEAEEVLLLKSAVDLAVKLTKTKTDPEPKNPNKQSQSVKVQDTISTISKSSAAGSSLTKNSKRRKSFRFVGRRRSSLKDSSLKLFSCLVSEVHDTEDASITSLKSEMPKSTKYQEKSSCSIQ